MSSSLTDTAKAMADPYTIFLYAIKSPRTRYEYIRKLRGFFDFVGLEGPMEQRALIFTERSKQDESWAYRNIMGFLLALKQRSEKKEIGGSTIQVSIAAIKLFCEMNEIDDGIKWRKITRGLPRARTWARDRAPTREELAQLCKYPDRRIKPIVTIPSSSGIRLGAWDYLKWGDIQYIEGKDVARMRVYAGEDEEYFTYISGEAYKALKEWMDFRAMSGERITEDSWLMRQLWNVRRGGVIRPRRLKVIGVKKLIANALQAQGLRGSLPIGKKRYEFQASHGFRKYFKTHAQQVMQQSNVEKLMGHRSRDYSNNSYYRPTDNDLLEDYLKAVPLLTINDPVQQPVDITHDPQFLKLVQALIDGGQLKADWQQQRS